MEAYGRIWFDQIKNGHPYFEVSITVPMTDPAGLGWKRVFNGVNGHLWYDSNRDGTPDTLIAELGNDIPVQLVPGGWYKIKCGEYNGTISLELPQ